MIYKEELKKEMLDLIQQFFREEQGNRLTSFNINGLLGAMNQLFEKHRIEDRLKKTGA